MKEFIVTITGVSNYLVTASDKEAAKEKVLGEGQGEIMDGRTYRVDIHEFPHGEASGGQDCRPIGIDGDGNGVWKDMETGETYNAGEPLTLDETREVIDRLTNAVEMYSGDYWEELSASLEGHSKELRDYLNTINESRTALGLEPISGEGLE